LAIFLRLITKLLLADFAKPMEYRPGGDATTTRLLGNSSLTVLTGGTRSLSAEISKATFGTLTRIELILSVENLELNESLQSLDIS
jgi:hypothetical protein